YPRPNAQFGRRLLEIAIHRTSRQAEYGADISRALALADPGETFELARAQSRHDRPCGLAVQVGVHSSLHKLLDPSVHGDNGDSLRLRLAVRPQLPCGTGRHPVVEPGPAA